MYQFSHCLFYSVTVFEITFAVPPTFSIAAFAEAELGALVLSGGSGLNTGLPLTENLFKRQQQIKEGEKKRAAAVLAETTEVASAAAKAVAKAQAKAKQPTKPPQKLEPRSPETPVAARVSSSMSSLAKPGQYWT